MVAAPSMELAHQRVSAAQWYDGNWNANTLVRFLGYLQGRQRVACSDEPGDEPDYPHADGVIGEWGWGVLDHGLRDPIVHHDFMTRCAPKWVGAFGWRAIEPYIATLSSW